MVLAMGEEGHKIMHCFYVYKAQVSGIDIDIWYTTVSKFHKALGSKKAS